MRIYCMMVNKLVKHPNCEAYFEIASTRKSHHEEGLNNINHYYNIFLPMLWRVWLCGLWKFYSRESPYWIWILRIIWLIDFANACIVLRLIGGYQAFGQPQFALVDSELLFR